MIKIGQKVKFNPFKGINTTGLVFCDMSTTGIVKYVNTKHRWFSVEYGDPKMRISYDFNDIGKDVKICKG